MHARFSSTAICAAVVGISGCASANWDSIYRTYKVDKNDSLTSVLIDAKQRAIIAKRVAPRVIPLSLLNGPRDSDSGLDPSKDREVKVDGGSIVCAEPSPDVFTAISQSFASSGSFSGTSQEAQLALSYALAESAGELRRARTIQLLRDSLFNTCLGYMNSALSEEKYERLLNKYADETLTLLAVEQITPQAVTAPLTLSSDSSNGAGRQSISNQAPTNTENTTKNNAASSTSEAAKDKQGQQQGDEPNNTLKDSAEDSRSTASQASDDTSTAVVKAKSQADSQLDKANKDLASASAAFLKALQSPDAHHVALDNLKKAVANQKAMASKAAAADKAGVQAPKAKLAATSSPSARKTGTQTPNEPSPANSDKQNAKQASITAPYPPGQNIQSLAPPTNAAVNAVDDMVQVFLNNTLINKCLDNITDSANSGVISAAGTGPFESQIEYNYYLTNRACFEILNATLPASRAVAATAPAKPSSPSGNAAQCDSEGPGTKIPKAPPSPKSSEEPGSPTVPPPSPQTQSPKKPPN